MLKYLLLLLLLFFLIIGCCRKNSHVKNLLFPPKDLYKLEVEDSFNFYENGYTKKYKFQPKYTEEIFSLGYLSKNQTISKEDKFEGKIKIDFISNDKIIQTKVVNEQKACHFADADKTMKLCKAIDLLDFRLPKGEHIEIAVTVIEGDLKLKKYKDDLVLFIRVSPIP